MSAALTAPFPWFGGKRRAASTVWAHLGDPGGYVEPFAGSAAVLLARPAFTGRRVETLNDSDGWLRVLTPSVTRASAGGDGTRAVFLDPPYATSGDLYAEADDTGALSAATREWCAANGDDTRLRVILCGYDTEHDDLLGHGWRRIDGRAGGGAGYSIRADNGRRERLWLSPACLDVGQASLFEMGATP